MATTSQRGLPDDVFLDIVKHLNTARDVAHVQAASRLTHDLVRRNGWRGFVNTQFSLNIPPGLAMDGRDMAKRLTHLDRCWNKRGVYLTVYEARETAAIRGILARSDPRQQSLVFQSIIEAHMLSSSQHELLVYGAGEDLKFRRRPLGCETRDRWRGLDGQEMGYHSGDGDVTALSILERRGPAEVVVGRANGDLQLLSADFKTLGESSQRLLPLDDDISDLQGSSPGYKAIMATAWQPKAKLLASCRSSMLTLYNLSNTEDEELEPVTYYDASSGKDRQSLLVRNAKFMSEDVIACGLGGTNEPLRWGKITPTGITFFNAARNYLTDKDAEMGPISMSRPVTTVRAIEPVSKMNENILLSAWEDGSHRLTDLRTPSEYDALYRDRFQPYQPSGSLLVYGSERFLAGNNMDACVRFFDFRYSRSYHHSVGMPCSAKVPVPGRSYLHKTEEAEPANPIEKCDHATGQLCTWHDLSIQESWRPDASIHVGNPVLDRIYGLTKASDISTSFYCAFRGSIIEMTWGVSEDITREMRVRRAPKGWVAYTPKPTVTLMEMGIGLCSDERWMDRYSQRVPERYFHVGLQPVEDTVYNKMPNWCRLDPAFRSMLKALGYKNWRRAMDY